MSRLISLCRNSGAGALVKSSPSLLSQCRPSVRRTTRSRFGPQIQELVKAKTAHFLVTYNGFFKATVASGEWTAQMSAELAVGYL